MQTLHYSRSAEVDLEEIAEYTIRAWGRAQSATYIDELQSCCEMIARNPLLGRACDQLAPGLRRIEQRKHVIFYRLESDRVSIFRILHERRLPNFPSA